MAADIVRFQPGTPIDTSKILEIVGLSATSSHWQEIEAAYPEIKAAGPRASFRGAHNVTIFPPVRYAKKNLRSIAGLGTKTRHIYTLGKDNHPEAVLVHVEGGYASLHIYRLKR